MYLSGKPRKIVCLSVENKSYVTCTKIHLIKDGMDHLQQDNASVTYHHRSSSGKLYYSLQVSSGTTGSSSKVSIIDNIARQQADAFLYISRINRAHFQPLNSSISGVLLFKVFPLE